MLKDLQPTWDLESIFPGGSESPQLQAYLKQLEEDIAGLAKGLAQGVEDWEQLTERVQDIAARLRQAGAFINCLNAQNVKDEKAKLLAGGIQQLRAAMDSLLTTVDQQMLDMDEEKWQQLLKRPAIKPIAWPLDERRRRARAKMPSRLEKLATDLAVDGYHGWGNLYNVITGRMAIPFEKEGKKVELSVGQAANCFASPDPRVRSAMADKWEQAWGNEAELCANALNHLGGFRWNLYRNRGWDSILREPLEINRMTEATLDAMWGTIAENKDVFVRAMERKAKLLGIDKLGWFDRGAPLGQVQKQYSFDEAANFVVEQYGKVSPIMAKFAANAFKKSWIEAEDRGGKRAGAFCTSFPASSETRVFMTFSGNASNLSTLAHEMGHAFHQHVMSELPVLTQRYAMNVAETASTFAEMVVADAAVKSASNQEEKIALLGGKVMSACAFMMDIHSRFLFETRFYQARRRGPVGVDQLNELMVAAQREAFQDALSRWHPHFWASKLHFYTTGVPFYNFPYTFGYLFSAGIYALAAGEGSAFEQKYIELLRDTGRMQVEDLARKHLGVDLTKPDFWQQAIDMAAADARRFLELTE